MSKLPAMLLKGLSIFPNEEIKLELNNPLTDKLINLSIKKFHKKILIVLPKDPLEENVKADDLPTVVVESVIKQKIVLPNDHIRIVLMGKKRIKVKKYFNSLDDKDILMCDYGYIDLPKLDEEEEFTLKKELIRLLKQYIRTSDDIDNSILQDANENTDISLLTDKLAILLNLSLEKRTNYIEEINPIKRANNLITDFIYCLQLLKLDKKVNMSLQRELDRNQKEFIIKERIKVLEKELGEDNKRDIETSYYEDRLNLINVTNKTKQKVLREIKKYSMLDETSPETSFVRNYLETFFNLPWDYERIEATDLKYISSVLNKTHYGLEEIKNRILEYAAMKSRNPMLDSPIICLVGPPGIGKSTIASSIANALNRDFYKISVGGLNDSSELIGHRRTYLGSSPGKILTSISKCGSKNPVLLIDEVDKMVKDYKGDPASVLLDILDPNLNQTFTDSYLEEPFDLSHVLFILTANYINDIPMELRDRLEIIELSSYTTIEKVKLAKEYLIPSIYLEYHISNDEVQFSDDALEYLIINYTNEAGVRDLRRKLSSILRKIIMTSVKKKETLHILIEKKDVKKYLDDASFLFDKQRIVLPGLINALAVTQSGGKVLQVESIMYDGSGKVNITGLPGDIIKESIQVVISYLKANSKIYHFNKDVFSKKDIHLHMLEGAIPKNGPSAGVAITTSIISLLKNIVVSDNVAMTGEMTLRGEIIRVGGIKEKVISAYNSGIKKIYLPYDNKIDIKYIPTAIIKKLDIVFVKTYEEIYKDLFC